MTPATVTDIRKGSGLTQEGLAHRLGISVSAVRNWEQGLRRPSGPMVAMLQAIRRGVGR